MSVVTSERLSIRVSASTRKELRRRASAAGRKESDLVRDAIRDYLKQPKRRPKRSLYDAWKERGLVGCLKRVPNDLSTNPKYLEGFGRDR